MDPETQKQVIDVARQSFDMAERTGLLKRIFSWFNNRQPDDAAQPVDYREEALTALRENAVEKFATVTLTAEQAAQILQPDFSLDDLDLDKVNSTWQRHWTEGASKVGIDDEERRTWWARLLAGEIQHPETYSLRTLAVMDTLSTKEARLFTKLSDYIWKSRIPVLILPRDTSGFWKPDFDEATLLESAGLAKFDSIGEFTWGTTDEDVARGLLRLPMIFGNDAYYVQNPESKPIKLPCGKLFLTDIGRAVYTLTTPNHQQSYRDEILTHWRQTYTVQQLNTQI